MTSSRALQRSGWMIALVSSLLHSQFAWCDEGPAAILLQRITVPKGRIDEVGVRLLPVDRTELDKAVAELNAKHKAIFGPAQPSITHARYTATFEEERLLRGSAELKIEHPHSESAQLSLAPLGLAVEQFRWDGDPSTPAIAGFLADGSTVVQVSESATLTFDWTRQGKIGPERDCRFDLSFPTAAISEIRLTLPKTMVPECGNAIVTKLSEEPTIDNRKFNNWLLELGSISETELRVVPNMDDATSRTAIIADATADYRISSTGLELQSTFQVHVYGQPTKSLTIDVDAGLQVAQTKLGARSLDLVPISPNSQDFKRYSLLLPTAAIGGPYELTITAYSPVVIDKPWKLPKVHLNTVAWKTGSASLQIVEPLGVSQLEWPHTLLRSFEPLPAPASGELRTFDILRSDTTCKLLISRQTPQLSAQSATAIKVSKSAKVSESAVTAEFNAFIEAAYGDVFSIDLNRGVGWRIDSIETKPPQIDRVESLRGSRGLKQRVVLQRALNDKRPVTLVVKAHRSLPVSESLKGSEMRPVTIENLASNSRLIAVSAELPLQLNVNGDAAVERVASLSDIERQLLGDVNATLVFRDGPTSDRLNVVPRSLPPRYHGTIDIDVEVEATSISQQFVIRCEPLSSRVGSLRIRFTPPPSREILWSSVGDGVDTLSATRLSPDGHEWEVYLRRPRDVPFEIRAAFSNPSSVISTNGDKGSEAAEAIVLASLPDAESQRGAVTISTKDSSDFTLVKQGLTAVPIISGNWSRLPTGRARYRYSPAQQSALHLTRKHSDDVIADAWVWESNLTSQIDVNGDTTHALRLQIENVGLKRTIIRVPAGALVDQVEINGEQMATVPNHDTIVVPLPSSERYPIVFVRYTTHGKPLGTFTRREMLRPSCDLRCLAQTWDVWVPSGYEFASGASAWQIGGTDVTSPEGVSWERRLFGREIFRRTGEPWNIATLWGANTTADIPNTSLQTEPIDDSSTDIPLIGNTASQLLLAGWHKHSIQAAKRQVVIGLCRSDVLQTFRWASLFVATACGLWLGHQRPSRLFVAVVIVAALTLLVPIGFAIIARSILHGLFAASVLCCLRRDSQASPVSDIQNDSMSFRLTQRADSVSASAIIAIAGILLFGDQLLIAQDSPANNASQETTVFHLYDPVDEDGVATGDYVYISPEFFDFLEAFKMRLGTRRAEAVVTRANYSLPLSTSPMMALQPSLTVDFELNAVAEGMTTIQLPFERREVQLIEATFDEQRVYPSWNSSGDALNIEVEVSTRHTLRLVLRPLLTRTPKETQLDIAVPMTADSRLTLSGVDSASIDIPSAFGEITRTNRLLDAKLGPVQRLQVNWGSANTATTESSEVTASQLIWLRPESEIISVDAQFSLSVLSGQLKHVDLLVDRRLTLLTPDSVAKVDDSAAADSDFYKVRYQLDRNYGVNELVTIIPQFAITDVRSLDSATGPLIQLADTSIDGSLLAISSAKGLATDLQGVNAWPVITPAEFAQAWGATELPMKAFRLPTEQAEWSFATKPLASQISNSDSTTLNFGRRVLHVAFHSELQAAGTGITQISVAAPPGLNIERVQALQQGIHTIDHRYSRSDDNTITVFLDGTVLGNIDLAIEGTLAIPQAGKFNYDPIRILNAETREHDLTIARHPEVLVDLAAPTPTSYLPHGQAHQGRAARIVRVVDLLADVDMLTSPVVFQIANNPSSCNGKLTTKVDSNSNAWSITADLTLQVLKGVVDTVRLQVPRALVDTVRLDPPVPFDVQEVPGQSELNLIIRPRNAIDKSFTLHLTADLVTDADGSLSAPSVEILDAPQVERFLVLPKYADNQEIEWDIQGLEQPTSDNSHTTYRIRRRRMRAVVREVKQSAGTPRLLLTDIEINLQHDSKYFGTANYDLVPGALERCALTQPSGVEILHISVDDVPGLVQHDGRTTTIELQAERLPQRITVIFTGAAAPLANSRRRWSLAAPTLAGIESQKTLWSLRRFANEPAFVPLLDHAILDVDATQRTRDSVIEEVLAYGSTSQIHTNDRELWVRRWQDRKAAEPDRISHAAFWPRQSLGDEALIDQDAWTYSSFEGTAPQLTVVQRSQEQSDQTQRFALAIAICIGAWFIFTLVRLERIRESILRWPWVPGVMTGIIWWLWLTPSAVGWLIIVVFVIGSLWPAWRTRAVR